MIVAVTPNPALDRTLRLSSPPTRGELHRVLEVREAAGGKGVNLARAVAALGGRVLVAGFLAGFNGRKYRQLLRTEGLEGVFVEIAGETRECHILLADEGHPTEVYESGPAVTLDDWRALLELLPPGRLVLSGSVAPGLDAADYRTLLASLPQPPVVDTGGELLRIALEEGAALIAPNRHELGEIAWGEPLEAARTLYRRYGVPLLLTLGADGAAWIGEHSYRATAPAIEVLNPVGSGDCLLGAFLLARQRGLPLDEALRYGVAAGSDNARRGGGGTLSSAGVEALCRQIRVERLE